MVSFGLLGCLTTHLKALSILYKTMIPSDLEIRTIGSLTKVAKFCQISQNKTQCPALSHSQRIRVQSSLCQSALPSLPTAWLIRNIRGGRYLSISGNHWKKHAQFWSEQTDVKPQITINKLCFWYCWISLNYFCRSDSLDSSSWN